MPSNRTTRAFASAAPSKIAAPSLIPSMPNATGRARERPSFLDKRFDFSNPRMLQEMAVKTCSTQDDDAG
jgi:hypothetical protein